MLSYSKLRYSVTLIVSAYYYITAYYYSVYTSQNCIYVRDERASLLSCYKRRPERYKREFLL